MKEITSAFLIPLEFWVTFYPRLQLHFEKKTTHTHTHTVCEKVFCMYVCRTSMDTLQSFDCLCTTSRISLLWGFCNGWSCNMGDHKWLIELWHILKMFSIQPDLLQRSPIPTGLVNPHECAVEGRTEVFLFIYQLHHLFNVCWVFLGFVLVLNWGGSGCNFTILIQ